MTKFNVSLSKSGKKPVHPNSRKAKQISKRVNRDAKMVKKRAKSNMKLQVLGSKLMWFKENMDNTKSCFTREEVEDLIQSYIDRNDEELESIKIKQSVGQRKFRQHASREDVIRISKATEESQFNKTGFEMVDLMDGENVKTFKLWNGRLCYLPNIKLRTFIKGTLSKKSKVVCDSSKLKESMNNGDDESATVCDNDSNCFSESPMDEDEVDDSDVDRQEGTSEKSDADNSNIKMAHSKESDTT